MPSEITQMAVPTITNFLQKLSLPKFSGKISDYPTFKQTFKDLTEGAGYPTSIIVEHLKNVVPKEHHHLIEASTTMIEIWKRLDEKYGDRTMTILTVQRNLVNLDLSKHKEYEKIERMHDEICKAMRLLTPLDAQDSITKDLQVVCKLIEKLP